MKDLKISKSRKKHHWKKKEARNCQMKFTCEKRLIMHRKHICRAKRESDIWATLQLDMYGENKSSVSEKNKIKRVFEVVS